MLEGADASYVGRGSGCMRCKGDGVKIVYRDIRRNVCLIEVKEECVRGHGKGTSRGGEEGWT